MHTPSASTTRNRRRRAVIAAFIAAPALVAAYAVPSTAAEAGEAATEAMIQVTVRPAVGTASQLGGALDADGYDIAGGQDGALYVLVPAGEVAELAGRSDVTVVAEEAVIAPDTSGEVDLDAVLPAKLDGRDYPTFWGGYRTVKGHMQFMKDLETEYPDLVKVVDFGKTWQDADKLRAVCITANAQDSCQLDPDVEKPRLLLTAQTHAREITTSELMWRTETYLIDGYGKKADATSILDSTEVWIVNNVNPTATKFVEKGLTEQGTGSTSPAWQRKTMNDSYSETSCGTVYASRQEGIDLNRSFDIAWGEVGTSDDPCDQTYGGPSAASEPETTAQVALAEMLFRDQRDEAAGWDEPAPLDTSGSFMNFHSYSNLVMPPWSHWRQRTANDEGLRSLSFRLSHYNGYETGQSSEILYPSSGGTDDWTYQDLGVSGVTYEMGPGSGTCAGFFPAYSCQDRFEDENLPSLLYAAIAARAPYQLTLGPTITSVKAKAKAGKVKITSEASDDAYGTFGVDRPAVQDVKQARLYVGKAPWDGGKATKMKIKGSGDTVKAKASVKPGKKKKLAWVQAKDADGNWGPTQAVWIPKK